MVQMLLPDSDTWNTFRGFYSGNYSCHHTVAVESLNQHFIQTLLNFSFINQQIQSKDQDIKQICMIFLQDNL